MNDSKSLNTIMTLTKIAKVLSMIVFVFLIIGVVFSAIGCIMVPTLKNVIANVDWDEVTRNLDVSDMAAFKEVFGSFDPVNISSWLTKALICAIVVCAAQAVVAFMAYRYFKRVIEAGTPFTFKGADELKVLGIVSLCVALGTSIVSSIIMSGAENLNISLGGNLAPGIAFLEVTVIFRHGAEMRERVEAPALPFG
ncbi:MAG: hypothetical protein IKZ82_11535, partial [Clostridia bacterium]|nr:hypothetical protein [Clostridia bacterium]